MYMAWYQRSVNFIVNISNYMYNYLFKDLIENIFEILFNFKKIVALLVFSYIYFYILHIQIVIFFISMLYYVTVFVVIFFLLQTDYTISYKNLRANSSRLFFHSVVSIIVLIPNSIAFNMFYNFLQFIYGIKLNGFKSFLKQNCFILLLIPFIIGIFYIRSYILKFFNIYGVVYITVLICSKFVNNLFFKLNFNYESYKSKYQHILLNMFINNDNIQYAIKKKLILKPNYEIIFNMLDFIFNKFNKFTGLEKLVTGFNVDKNVKYKSITVYENGHLTKKYVSDKYSDKNLTNNLTSSKTIQVITKNNEKKLYKTNFETWPNVQGQDKENAFTPTYESGLKSVIKELPPKWMIDDNVFSLNSLNSLVTHRNDPIIFNKDNKFYEVQGSLTVSDYSKEYKINVFKKFQLIDDFEKKNQDYLSTPEGAHEYLVLKLYLFTKFYLPFDIFKQ